MENTKHCGMCLSSKVTQQVTEAYVKNGDGEYLIHWRCKKHEESSDNDRFSKVEKYENS